jgi:hypothetical protein
VSVGVVQVDRDSIRQVFPADVNLRSFARNTDELYMSHDVYRHIGLFHVTAAGSCCGGSLCLHNVEVFMCYVCRCSVNNFRRWCVGTMTECVEQCRETFLTLT